MTTEPARKTAQARGGDGDTERAWLRSTVRLARRGDREAFGALYERYGRLVHGILLARLPPVDVPDLVQEVFLTAMGKLGTLRKPEAFAAWLGTLTRRAAAQHYRSGPHRHESPGSPAATSAATPPGLTAEGIAVFDALARLPETYREPLVLRLVEGMSGREIAAATGLTEGSVRVTLCRGMKRLRAALGGDGDE